MAEVHEGLALGEHGFERKVAIKRLPQGRDPTETDLAAFIDEARLASCLHHPNIVSVLDFGVHEDLPFMVLEWVDGADLGVLVQRAEAVARKIPEAVALHVVTEVAHALAHAHRARGASGRPLGLVHRDVSPDNILISYTGDVKLTDFGIARAGERLSRTIVGQAKGKLAWMAPEQAQATTVDPRTDVFSLGCVLLWLLHGQSPIADQSARRRMLQGADFEIPPHLPDDLFRIIRRATRVRASDRYDSAEAMAHDTGTALSSRLDLDARGSLMAWLTEVGHAHTVEQPHPLAQMMGFDLVLNGPDAPLLGFSADPSAQVPQDTVRENPSDPTRVLRVMPVTTTPIGTDPRVIRPTDDRGDSEAPENAPPETSIPHHLGQVLHGYRLVEPLGLGASAWVYRAEHTVLPREAAIKILTATAARHAGIVRRLMREAETLSRLDHPNIVSVRDFGYTEGGAPFMTMELVYGDTLKRSLRSDGPFETERAVPVLQQIASALAEAHTQGVVHRDLKLSNVMLVHHGGQDLVKVLDFGIARLVGHPGTKITGTDALLGTPQYMAPEQFTNPGEVGPAADIYALGIVAYVLISGRLPYPGQRLEVLDQKLRGEPLPLTTQTGLEPLIGRMLSFDPQQRPTATEVSGVLERMPFAVSPNFAFSSQDSKPTRTHTSSLPLGPGASDSAVTDSGPTKSGYRDGFFSVPRIRLFVGLGIAGAFITSTVLAFALLSLDTEMVPAPIAPSEPRGTPDRPLDPPLHSSRTVARTPAPPSEPPLPPSPVPVAVPQVETAPPELDAPPPAVSAKGRPYGRSHRRSLTTRLSRTTVDRKVAARVKRQGLTEPDVIAHPAYQNARENVSRAAFRNDPEKLKEALDELDDAIASVEIDERLLNDKLTRVEGTLKRAASQLPPDVLETLESRYLDARSSLPSASSPEARRRLARTLSDLERAVNRAKATE